MIDVFSFPSQIGVMSNTTARLEANKLGAKEVKGESASWDIFVLICKQ